MKWPIRVGLALGLAALCWLASLLWPSDVDSQAPPLIATWHGSRTLVITWQVTEPVCVWLTGGERQAQPLAVPCGKIGTAELDTSGDQNYVPQEREWIELRNANGQTIARLAVPPQVWVVILPIVVRQ